MSTIISSFILFFLASFYTYDTCACTFTLIPAIAFIT
nr:MAG TPA: hypothetical protein [Caudoviricetes sp.]